MSVAEFTAYIRGGKLMVNRTNWKLEGSATTARGFCFFPAGPLDDRPEDRIEYLTGITSMSVCAVFDTDETMEVSRGRYRDPNAPAKTPAEMLCELISGEPIGIQYLNEYCIPTYSRDTFRLVRAGYPDPINHTIKWMMHAMSEPDQDILGGAT